jgi:hypothetical protein
MPIEFIPILRLDTMYGHCDDLKIEFREMDLTATVQYYRTAGTFSRTFSFGFVQAHSLYSEMLMPLTARHCVNQLCEVAGSEWVARYRERVSPDLRGLRHYAIRFTKCGYLEVLSHQFDVGPEIAVADPAQN